MKCHDVVAMKNNLLENVFGTLTHLCLSSYKWDIGKQCRPRSDAGKPASDQDQHSFQ